MARCFFPPKYRRMPLDGWFINGLSRLSTYWLGVYLMVGRTESFQPSSGSVVQRFKGITRVLAAEI